MTNRTNQRTNQALKSLIVKICARGMSHIRLILVLFVNFYLNFEAKNFDSDTI